MRFKTVLIIAIILLLVSVVAYFGFKFTIGEVKFEGYTPYDDRINSPILYKDNYDAYGNMVSFKQDTTLPGPYVVCNTNTCGQTQTSIDVWGCPVYGGGGYCYDAGTIPGSTSNWCAQSGCIYDPKPRPPSCSQRPQCGGRKISDAVYQCQTNTCGGTESETDSYGCPIYRYSTTSKEIVGKADGCYPRIRYPRVCEAKYGSDVYCDRDESVCKRVVTTLRSCGGASTSTCQGDDCYVKGICGEGTSRIPWRWYLDSPLKTLSQWKTENPTKEKLINLGCNSCNPQIAHYEDDKWVLDMSAGFYQTSDDGCKGISSFNTPTASNPLKLSAASTKSSSGSGNYGLGPHSTMTLASKNIRNTDNLLPDLKIVIECSGGYCASVGESGATSCDHPSCSIKIGKTTYTTSTTPNTYKPSARIGTPKTMVLEMFSSRLDPNIADIYIDGLFKETLNFAGMENVNVTFIATRGSPTLDIKQFGFMIPYSCVQGPEELLGVESFVGPRSLSITDLRYMPTKFCTEHPAVVLSSTGAGSTTTNEVYDRLRKGEVMQIPATQSWTLFSIFYNDGSIEINCPEGAYDVELEKCTAATGLAYFCGKGTVWDDAMKACVVSSEEGKCPFGVFDTSTQECIEFVNLHYVCDKGEENLVLGGCEYNVPCDPGDKEINRLFTSNTCIKKPLAYIACIKGTSFNPVSGFCEAKMTEAECNTIFKLYYPKTDDGKGKVYITMSKSFIVAPPETKTGYLNGTCVVPVSSKLDDLCADGILTQPKYNAQIFTCVKFDMPQFCLDMHITDVEECKAYIQSQYESLSLSLQEKIELINQLTTENEEKMQLILLLSKNIEEMNQLIANFRITIDEQKQYITQLNMTVVQQAALITSFEMTIQQQAVYIQSLNLSVQRQAELIASFEFTVQQQAEFIEALGMTVERQAQLIQDFNLTVQYQADLIDALSDTAEQQAGYIIALNLNIEQQAEMINALSRNLAEKAALVALLQVENEVQAALIAEMEESFANQGEILGLLNLTIADDIIIINALSDRIDEQSVIITNMGLTNQQQAQLIVSLEDNVEQQALIITQMRLTNQQQAAIIVSMGLTNQQQAELILLMQLNNQEQAQIISYMNLTNQQQADLILQLTSNIDEQIAIIANMKLTNEEQENLIMMMTQNIEEQQELIDKLEKYNEQLKMMNLIKIVAISILVIIIVIGGIIIYRKRR